MKKHLAVLTLFTILTGFAAANPPEILWYQTLWEAHGWCSSLLQVPGNGYLVAGFSRQDSSSNFMLVGADTSGIQQWIRHYGGLNEEICNDAARTADGGCIMVGSTESFVPGILGYPAVWLLKTDANGDSQWSRTYGSEFPMSWGECVRQTFDGGYIIAAERSPDVFDTDTGWLIKTDADGDTMWTRIFHNFALTSVVQLREGGFLVAGAIMTPRSEYHMAVEFLSAFGDSVWSRVFIIRNYSMVRDVVELENGDCLLTGVASWMEQPQDMVVLRMNSSGDTLWQRQVAGLGWNEPADLCLTQDGDFVIAGYTSGPGGVETSIWLTKVSSDGTIEWNTTYDTPASDMASGILPLSNGGFMIAGMMYECFPPPCMWMMRLTPEIMDAADNPAPSPSEFSLAQNYPNPFNAETRIEFSLAREEQTKLEVFDLNGRLVSTLVDNRLPAGAHAFSFDGSRLSSGVYVYRMQAGSFSQSRKFILLK